MRELRTRKLTATLTDADVAFAREARAKGAAVETIADLLGASVIAVAKMLSGRRFDRRLRRYERIRKQRTRARGGAGDLA